VIPLNRGLDTEMGEPKYARIERERRWLVDAAARPKLEGPFVTHISDRYIEGTRMRLRRMDRSDLGETKWKLTKKYECADPAARPIVTTYLTEAEYALLCALPARDLVKLRLHFRHRGEYWSLDVFAGALAGLELVECEAPDEAALAGLQPPDWVLREVTDLPQWQGGALAANGIPEDRWPSS
jgi:CYTH domain-containing protein